MTTTGVKLASAMVTTGYNGGEKMLAILPRGGTAGRIPIFYCHGFAFDITRCQ